MSSKFIKNTSIIVGVFAAVVAISLMTILLYQHKLMYFPYKSSRTLNYDDVVYCGDGSSAMVYIVKEKENAALNSSTLIYFHGNAGNFYDRMNDINALLSLKHVKRVVAFSYRGFAPSTLAQDTDKITQQSIFSDSVTIVNYIMDKYHLVQNQIILFGESLGTAAVIRIATIHFPHLKAIILKAAFKSIPHVVEHLTKNLFSHKFLKYIINDVYDSFNCVPYLNVPAMFIHCLSDYLTPYEDAYDMYRFTNSSKKMWLPISAGCYPDPHNFEINSLILANIDNVFLNL